MKGDSVCGKLSVPGKSFCRKCYAAFKQKKYRRNRQSQIKSGDTPNTKKETSLHDLPEYKALQIEEIKKTQLEGIMNRKEFPIGICIQKFV
jgi:uncharacterized OB-fold protein